MLDPETLDADVLRELRDKAERVDADDMEFYPDPDVVAFDVCYLGSLQNLSPTGKFYAPWTSGISEEEADADADWCDAIEYYVGKSGGFVAWGAFGGGCDVHILWPVTKEE